MRGNGVVRNEAAPEKKRVPGRGEVVSVEESLGAKIMGCGWIKSGDIP